MTTGGAKSGKSRDGKKSGLRLYRLLPMSASLSIVTTIVSCYFLSRAYIPETFQYPFISEMGIQSPAKWVYAAGFSFSGVLWVLAAGHVRRAFEKVVDKSYRMSWFSAITVSYWLMIVAAMGFTVQAIIPLQPDHVDLLLSGDLAKNLSTQTTVHIIFAFIFFIASIVHHVTMVYFFWSNAGLKRALGRVAFISLILKAAVFAIGLVIFIILLKNNPAGDVPMTGAELALPGLLQWSWISSILIFFATYTIDLLVLA